MFFRSDTSSGSHNNVGLTSKSLKVMYFYLFNKKVNKLLSISYSLMIGIWIPHFSRSEFFLTSMNFNEIVRKKLIKKNEVSCLCNVKADFFLPSSRENIWSRVQIRKIAFFSIFSVYRWRLRRRVSRGPTPVRPPSDNRNVQQLSV